MGNLTEQEKLNRQRALQKYGTAQERLEAAWLNGTLATPEDLTALTPDETREFDRLTELVCSGSPTESAQAKTALIALGWHTPEDSDLEISLDTHTGGKTSREASRFSRHRKDIEPVLHLQILSKARGVTTEPIFEELQEIARQHNRATIVTSDERVDAGRRIIRVLGIAIPLQPGELKTLRDLGARPYDNVPASATVSPGALENTL